MALSPPNTALGLAAGAVEKTKEEAYALKSLAVETITVYVVIAKIFEFALHDSAIAVDQTVVKLAGVPGGAAIVVVAPSRREGDEMPSWPLANTRK